MELLNSTLKFTASLVEYEIVEYYFTFLCRLIAEDTGMCIDILSYRVVIQEVVHW